MKEKTGVNRRQFLVSTSAAAIGVAALQGKELAGGNRAAGFSIGLRLFDPLFPPRACYGSARSPAFVHERKRVKSRFRWEELEPARFRSVDVVNCATGKFSTGQRRDEFCRSALWRSGCGLRVVQERCEWSKVRFSHHFADGTVSTGSLGRGFRIFRRRDLRARIRSPKSISKTVRFRWRCRLKLSIRLFRSTWMIPACRWHFQVSNIEPFHKAGRCLAGIFFA